MAPFLLRIVISALQAHAYEPIHLLASFLQEPTMDTELEYEEGVLMAAADYNIFMASELEDEPPAADPGPQDDGAADDSHLWEYADRTEKTGWQNRCALLIALAQMERFSELDRLLTKFGERQNIQQQLVFLISALQRCGDRGPKMLGYKW